ncbi:MULTISPECIES: glycine zipper 2TM domain-containing protein [Dyella]|uniref:Glycine zipper 2TM domain-containing protein n=2 Tax=Dyella TaxID=231454 RepID=A0A4V2NMG7_9GAMM|nr:MULTISPECIES: glycine zipper 2TM domain-containing protein [Dyella]TBR39156.1 glycine zipper 2TM domain-containing protein [Dyella terrae]TCI13257.1 glycine zipper 2TM domain-containing protein [Dyella soli]
MSKFVITALNLGLGIALATGLTACNRDANADGGVGMAASAGSNAPKYGRVVSVTPIREAAEAAKQVCKDEVVTQRAPVKDQHQIAGTAIGAVAGGLLGNQVGGGKGRTLATVAGAVGGGYAGHEIQKNHQQNNVTSSVQRKCQTVQGNSGDKIVAYDVAYEYNGVTRTVRMDHDPGDRVQIQEGVVAVSDAH